MPFAPLALTQFEVPPGVSSRLTVATVDRRMLEGAGGAVAHLQIREAMFPARGDRLLVEVIALAEHRSVLASWLLERDVSSWSAIEAIRSWSLPVAFVVTVHRHLDAPGVIRFALGVEVHDEHAVRPRHRPTVTGASS